MAEEESVLIKALPPASDYLTYLTIVEYNLTIDNLPILHQVLQDEKLNVNIGWDLIHLLVPLLPHSEQCLLDIARLGNPREVILKVTECLRLISYEAEEEPETGSSTKDEATSSKTPHGERDQAMLPLPVAQFVVLLSMLQRLHPRIKTKYPSRFLSTTLQAILASFSASVSHREEMIESTVRVIKSLRGIQRPVLPARTSSGMLSTTSKLNGEASGGQAQAGADPEAADTVDDSPEELAMQTKLLQSFVTFVLEEYMLNLPDVGDEDVPGMAWCSRIMERLHADRSPPHAKEMSKRFAEHPQLERRIDAVGQLGTLAKDLNVQDEDLLKAAVAKENVPDEREKDEDDPPTSASEIPLSRLGSLLLYSRRHAASILYDFETPPGPSLEIFPDHHELLNHCLSSHNQGAGTLGSEPDALIDAIIAVGLLCLERNAIGTPAGDEQFTEYLTITALLSANCASPTLRGHSHYLTSTVLRSHPDSAVRLAFIRDTLEHCPFENLKVSAVGWMKGETIEANPMPVPGHENQAEPDETSAFSTPLALDSIAPFLFPSLQTELVTAPTRTAWLTFQTNLSFYLATLNFTYLLLQGKWLHDKLAIPALWKNSDVAGSFIQPLRDASKRFSHALEEGGELYEERDVEVLAQLVLLDDTLERVTKSVTMLNE